MGKLEEQKKQMAFRIEWVNRKQQPKLFDQYIDLHVSVRLKWMFVPALRVYAKELSRVRKAYSVSRYILSH